MKLTAEPWSVPVARDDQLRSQLTARAAFGQPSLGSWTTAR